MADMLKFVYGFSVARTVIQSLQSKVLTGWTFRIISAMKSISMVGKFFREPKASDTSIQK
jgi:hypothetical protein